MPPRQNGAAHEQARVLAGEALVSLGLPNDPTLLARRESLREWTLHPSPWLGCIRRADLPAQECRLADPVRAVPFPVVWLARMEDEPVSVLGHERIFPVRHWMQGFPGHERALHDVSRRHDEEDRLPIGSPARPAEPETVAQRRGASARDVDQRQNKGRVPVRVDAFLARSEHDRRAVGGKGNRGAFVATSTVAEERQPLQVLARAHDSTVRQQHVGVVRSGDRARVEDGHEREVVLHDPRFGQVHDVDAIAMELVGNGECPVELRHSGAPLDTADLRRRPAKSRPAHPGREARRQQDGSEPNRSRPALHRAPTSARPRG